MSDRVSLGVQFDPDAELLEEFKEYKDDNGFTSRAETMRHIMREQIHQQDQRQQPAPGAISGYARTLAAHLSAYAVGTGVLTIVGVLSVGAGTVTAGVFLAGSLALMLAVHVEFSIAGDQA